jgi:hypothetical protein
MKTCQARRRKDISLDEKGTLGLLVVVGEEGGNANVIIG